MLKIQSYLCVVHRQSWVSRARQTDCQPNLLQTFTSHVLCQKAFIQKYCRREGVNNRYELRQYEKFPPVQCTVKPTTSDDNKRHFHTLPTRLKTDHKAIKRDNIFYSLPNFRTLLFYSNAIPSYPDLEKKCAILNSTPSCAVSDHLNQKYSKSNFSPRYMPFVQSKRFTHSRASPPRLSPIATSTDIKTFLNERSIVFEQGHTCIITTCPRHVRKRMNLSQVDKLYINNTTGYFVCHSCNRCGTWAQLQDNIEMLVSRIKDKKRKPNSCFEGQDLIDQTTGLKHAKELWDASLAVSELPKTTIDELLSDLGATDITTETLMKYKVRVTSEQNGLIFPSFGFDGNLQGIKLMTVEKSDQDEQYDLKTSTKSLPRYDNSRFNNTGLFGWNTITAKKTEVVLTSSELDALVTSQNTPVPVLSLPRGDNVLPQQILPALEQFTKVVLWLGGDHKTWESTKQFAKKLGENRCHLIRPDSEKPNALLAIQKGLPVNEILQKAKRVQHKSIVTFQQLRPDVYAQIAEADQISGVKWKRYPQLNRLMKGHRRGELTVFTGPTGSGKTTFMSDYSLDLCMQGVNTLWGSFEINNVRLLRTMLTQYAQTNLTRHQDAFDFWADKFEQLPMYFMTFHGQENTKRVIETMSHAVYVHDIAHVIVDNLQFMMGMSSQSQDRFLKQDSIISDFRKFATHMNCHVSLVIHPKKKKVPTATLR